MSHGLLFIQDFAVVMLVAGGVALLCQRIGLSAVAGYLLAGMVIGPYTPPFQLISDLDRVQTLAQLGLVFLIFTMGLHLSLSRLKRLGPAIMVAAFVGTLIIFNGCRLLGVALGWAPEQGLFIAGMLMVSSSAVVSKMLEETNATHEREGQLALGITVMEDVVAVVMLTLLTSMIQFGGARSAALLPAVGALGAFVVFLVLLSLLVLPKLLGWLSRDSHPELQTLVITGLLLGLGWLAETAGYSLALGAFVFGAIVGSTRHKAEVERVFEGVRQIFGAVFFVAVGMLADVGLVAEAWPMALALTGLALLLRPLACAFGLVMAGHTTRQSLRAGLTLTPLGEFSFIIAQLGVNAGILPKSLYPAAVGGSLLTAILGPVLARHAEALSGRIAAGEPLLLREWVAFYHDWLNRLRGRQTTSMFWKLAGRRIVHLGMHVLFTSSLILFANPIYERAVAALGRDWLFPNGLLVLFWTAFGLLLLPPLIAIWRNVTALSMILAEVATSGARRQRRLRPILEFALRSVALAVLTAWLFALLPSGAVVLGAATGVLVVLAGVAVVFWRRLVRLHSRLEIELMERFAQASQLTSASAWSAATLDGSSDWQIEIDEVTLPAESKHAGQTIAQLALRPRFGCSIVGIDRQGYGIVNPSADTVIYPRDKLLLLGPPAELVRAARYLGQLPATAAGTGAFEELTLETLTVPAGSPLEGRTLVELDLIRRHGVQVGAIRRDSERNLSPSGRDRLQAGDELLVLGTHQRIRQFHLWLETVQVANGTPGSAPA
ncbi:MAG TPA: cation:proton antiporter [Methylomirabilota bacterium]|nr:cation:proton antiporter [Methylomirabilota bacterium]